MITPLYLVSNKSHMFSRMSSFTTTYFITSLSGYRALVSPLHAIISALVSSLIIYQLFGHFIFNYITQPTFYNASLLIVITFTSIKNLTKQAYSLTNPPAFTLPLAFPCIFSMPLCLSCAPSSQQGITT